MVLAEVQQTTDGTTAAGVARPGSSSSTSCEQHGNTSTTKKRDRRTAGSNKKTATTNSGFSKTTLAGACDSTTSSCANNYTSLSEDCYSSGVDEAPTGEKKNPNEEIKSRFNKWTASWKNKKPATQVIIHPNRVVEHRDLFSPNARVGACGGASSTTDERTVSVASSRTTTSSSGTTSNHAAVGTAQRPGGKDDEDVEFDMQLEAIAEVLMEDEDEGFHVVDESKRELFPFSPNYDQDEAAAEDDFLADDAMNSATEELEPRGNSNGKQSGDGTGAATTTDASQQDKKLRSSTTLRQSSRNTYITAAGAARKQYTPVEIVLKASKLTALRRGSRSGGTIRKLREVLHDVMRIMRAKYCSKTGDSLKDMIHSEGARKNFYSATEAAAGGVSNIDHQQQVEPVHLLQRASKNNSSATPASSNSSSNYNSSSSDQSLQQQLLRLTCDSKRTASTFLHWLQRHFVLQRLPFPHSHPSGRLLTFELAPVVKSDLCVLLDNQVAAKNSNHAKNRQMPDENGVAGVCVLEQVAHTSLGLFDPVIGETISISSHCAWAAPLKSSDRLCLRSLSSCFSSSSSPTGEDFGGAGANNPLQRFVVMDVHFDYEHMNKVLANNNLREHQKVEKDLPMRERDVGEINHNGPPGTTSSLFLSDQEQDFVMKSNRFAALEQVDDVAKKKVVELQNQKTTDEVLDDIDARRKTVRSGQKKLKKNSFLNNGSSSGSANTGNSGAGAAVAGTSTTGPPTSTGAGTSSSGGAAPQRRSQLFRGAKIVSSAISRVDVVLESDFLNPPTTMGNLEDRMICNVPLMQQQNLIFANSGCTTSSSAGATSSRGSAGTGGSKNSSSCAAGAMLFNKTAPPAIEIGDIVLGYDLRKKVSNELEELERSGRNYPSVVLLCREMQQRNSCDESSTDINVRDDELELHGAGKRDHDEQLPSAGAAKNEASSAPRAGEASSAATATTSLVPPSQTDIAGNTSNANSVPSGTVTSKTEYSSRAEFPTCEVGAGGENNSQNFSNDQQRMLNSASSCKVDSTTSKDFDEIVAKHEDNPLVAGMIADLVRALEKSRR